MVFSFQMSENNGIFFADLRRKRRPLSPRRDEHTRTLLSKSGLDGQNSEETVALRIEAEDAYYNKNSNELYRVIDTVHSPDPSVCKRQYPLVDPCHS